MSKRGKIKSKVVQSTINNKDVMEMFHGVLGTGEGTDLDVKIVYPKYQKVVEHCTRFMRLLEALSSSALMTRFPAEAAHLEAYVSDLRDQAAAVFTAPSLETLHPADRLGELAGQTVDYSAVSREEYDDFATAYRAVKDSNLVNTIVVACNNLVPHKKSLEDPAALRDRFLLRSAGLTYAPLPGLPALNFKQIYISDRLAPADRAFVLMVLHKLYTISHDVYDTMSSPDIDVDEFVEVILHSLEDVKKHIPRCDAAFDKIRDSVGLLKGNFGNYYKDFVASNNPTIIMENFVIDVSKETKSSPKVTAQFRRIISHYRKLASQQAQNPQLRSLFAQVDKNFQELERRSRDADADSDDDSAGEGGGEDGGEDEGGSAREPREDVERRFSEAVAAVTDSGVGLGEALDGASDEGEDLASAVEELDAALDAAEAGE